MLKKDFFMAAMNAGEQRRRAFVISAFSLINEGQDDWKKDPYPFRIVQTPAGMFYVSPDTRELSMLADAKSGEPIFGIKEEVMLKAGEVPNLKSNITSTYGRLLFNYIALVYPFGNKLEYINERITPSKVEVMILPLFKDNPEKPEDRNDTDIYVDEYLNFCNAMFYLAEFTQLCVPAATAKTITAAPGIVELKNKLLEENKDRLHDPAVIAKIDAELVKYDKNYMKGDLGEGFLITDKAFNIVRKKLFGMHGAEPGLEDKVDVDLIPNSLSQGWDINKFPAMNNSLRAGSFNRGAETMKGGEAFKWLQRASSNINISMDDCGSRLGNLVHVTEQNLDWLVGFSIVSKTASRLVDNKEAAQEFIGKNVMVRSPMFCKAGKTDFCKTCVGVNLANNPTGLSVAVTQFGSVMMYINMSAAHSKGLTLAKMDYKKSIF